MQKGDAGEEHTCDPKLVGSEALQVPRDGVAFLRLGVPVLVSLAGQGTRPQAASGGGAAEARQNRVSLTVNLTVT